TLSNAMDVGDPSNFVRIEALFDKNINRIRQHIYSDSATDQETIATIKSIYEQYKYIIDPHGAVGCFVNEKYRKINPGPAHAVVLETAHPAKFADCVEPALNMKIEMPARLAACLNKQKNALKISSDFNTFREGLIAEMK
ncbi:MAG: threonine synthase, partial [Calditrichaceae bacterium]|nr:threonine synthase [Calditrichaceae bacterium]